MRGVRENPAARILVADDNDANLALLAVGIPRTARAPALRENESGDQPVKNAIAMAPRPVLARVPAEKRTRRMGFMRGAPWGNGSVDSATLKCSRSATNLPAGELRQRNMRVHRVVG
jgi:hypothetical protein